MTYDSLFYVEVVTENRNVDYFEMNNFKWSNFNDILTMDIEHVDTQQFRFVS